MAKKFVGLDGLKHFWSKAKTWITAQITSEVTARIAELVANAPEDLDTLKEIADWIKTHANDASAMNTQINTNKSDISALKTSVAGKADTGHTHDDRYFTETEVTNKLAGKSDTGHTHTKSQIIDFPTSLPANGGTANKASNGIFGILGGAKEASSSNFDDLLNKELGNDINGGLMGGSIQTNTTSLGIVAGWWNFLYIPHRTGFGGDNARYGTLLVTDMINNRGTLYIIHRINNDNYPAHRFDSVT